MAEFMPPDGDCIGYQLQADQGRVPKVSNTTGVKGQFGLGQSGGTGKKLKIFLIYRCPDMNLQNTTQKLSNYNG